MSEPKSMDKPFEISKWIVWEAYKKVKANHGAAGVDGESIAQFERERIVERTKEGWPQPASEAEWVAGPLPYRSIKRPRCGACETWT